MGGVYVAEIGYYNPLTSPHTWQLDKAAYAAWLKKGAQPTDTVRKLAARAAK